MQLDLNVIIQLELRRPGKYQSAVLQGFQRTVCVSSLQSIKR